MTLMRFDPFRELDRLAGRALNEVVRGMPMEAFRRGDEFFVYLDVPGIEEHDVEVTVERNVVNIRARRWSPRKDGDEVIVDERPFGELARQLFLGDNLDTSKLSANYHNGVLTLSIPVADESKPRRVELTGKQSERKQVLSGSH
ncbi:MAG: Hsp20/alpha crystallin family protein, partial [Mycobacteriales bacterium]